MLGKLYGIGIGPGDPELITLKGFRLLQNCPVVAYPAPDEGKSLARQIVASYLSGHQEEFAIRMPMVEQRFPAQEIYDWAAEQLGQRLKDGRDVAVLCEGDPFFYGSFMYLFGRMADKFAVEVVPGVSSLMACATSLSAPLAARNDILSVLPGTLDEATLIERITGADAVAIIKVGRHLHKIRKIVDKLGLNPHARYIEHATMSNQVIMPLSDIDKTHRAPYFSMILIHTRGAAWHV